MVEIRGLSQKVLQKVSNITPEPVKNAARTGLEKLNHPGQTGRELMSAMLEHPVKTGAALILATGTAGTGALLNPDIAGFLADKIPGTKSIVEQVNQQAVLSQPVKDSEALGGTDQSLRETSVYISPNKIENCEPIDLPKVVGKDSKDLNKAKAIEGNELAFVDKETFMQAVRDAGGKNVTALSIGEAQNLQKEYKDDPKAIITAVVAKNAETGVAKNIDDTSAPKTLIITAEQIEKYNNLVRGEDCKPEYSTTPPSIITNTPPSLPLTPPPYIPVNPLTPNDNPSRFTFNSPPPNTNFNVPPNPNPVIPNSPNFGLGISGGGFPLFNLGGRDRSSRNNGTKEITIIRENVYHPPIQPTEKEPCTIIDVPRGAHTEDGTDEKNKCYIYRFEDPNKADSLNKQRYIHGNNNPNIHYETMPQKR